MDKNLPYTAEEDIDGYRLVTFGTNDGDVKLTTSATDKVIGVTNYIGAPKGTTVDVNISNLGKVKLSGAVAKGDDLTASADGKAAKATAPTYGASSAAGDCVFGMALQAGVANDVIEFLRK